MGFQPDEEQKNDFKQMFARCGGTFNFNDFLSIFSMNSNPDYSEVEVKNSFRLLSKEYGRTDQMTIDRVRQILQEMGMEEPEIDIITSELQAECDEDGYFDFNKFVSQAF